jgi:sphingomyelin phosphodiesterase
VKNRFPAPETAAERPEFSKDWFYDAIAEEWPHIFHVNQDQMPTIKKAGFYAVKPRNGLRLIAMNTNYCYYLNWYALLTEIF